MLSLIKKLAIFLSLFSVLVPCYTKELPYTNIITCEKLSQQMNGQAFASLFKEPIQIKLDYRSNTPSNGCTITIGTINHESGSYQYIGSILVYHQSDVLALYQWAKKDFANINFIYTQQMFPFIVEGFMDKTLPSDSTFNAYLPNQYYLVLMLAHDVEGAPKSTVDNITPILNQFINIATQQIVNLKI